MTGTVSDYSPKHGVISLLDPVFSERVRRTWTLLENKLGLRGVLVMPFPHFSYQIAQDYGRSEIEIALRWIAEEVPRFTVRTTGLAEFDGPWPVDYIAIEGTPSLRMLHAKVWNACLPFATGAVEYYRPGAWVPHITLAHGEERNSVPLPSNFVSGVRDVLRIDDFRWEVPIDNLSLVWDDGALQRPVVSFPLEGS